MPTFNGSDDVYQPLIRISTNILETFRLFFNRQE